MTPLEYELLIEKIGAWGTAVYLIQDKLGDGKNGEIQKLKMELYDFKDTLENAQARLGKK